jgi:predicted metalloprotease with PDZ domain
MRGVNLELFEFDYDLQWVVLFVNGDERVLGRFGGRLPDDVGKYRSLDGLAYAMQAALERHKQAPPIGKAAAGAVKTPESYPAGARAPAKSCIHCHHVYDFRREWLQENKQWSRDEVWVYPLPENIGLTLAADRGNHVTAVAEKSPAAAAGLRAGDVLLDVNGQSVASFADVQYALHKAPAAGTVAVRWRRGDETRRAELTLAAGWKKTDVSWRRSLQELEPPSGLHGTDLTLADKKALGLSPKALAFRQGNFLTAQARQAGVLINDIVVGIDGQAPELTVRQFDAHVRLTYDKGDTVVLRVLRQGQPVELKLKLTP